ncbi:MAG: DMT family transporter [Planctomycetes bacterium]|nr:DMT family transporter [Planctomycetota bacterium]
MQFVGETAGLGAALSWACSTILFHRVPVPAAAMNWFKNLVSAICLGGTLAAIAYAAGSPLLRAGSSAWLFLTLSGLIGLVIGDTCGFRCLQILGPRKSAVFSTLVPPCAALFGWIALEERIGIHVVAGMLVTLAGVLVVVWERGRTVESAGHFPGTLWRGIAFGAAAAICQALGAVFSKLGMEGDSSPLEASFIRLLVAAALGTAGAYATQRLAGWGTLVIRGGFWRVLVPASILGTTIGIWLSLVAFKHTHVAIATTLTSTTPIFVLPLVRVLLGHTITMRAIAGALIALAGVTLLFAGPCGAT